MTLSERQIPVHSILKSQGVQGEGESYHIHLCGDRFEVEADSRLALEYAKSCLQTCANQPCLGDFLGKANPLFSFRPLLISAVFHSQLGVDLPLLFQEKGEKLTAFTKQVIDLGYNAVIFSTLKDREHKPLIQLSQSDFEQAVDVIRSKGVQVALHCKTEDCTSISNCCDYFFWQSGELGLQIAEATEYERVKEEIRFLEKNCKKPVIYFLPTQGSYHTKRQAEWLLRLAHEVKKETVLAFLSNSETHVVHPFFQKLSQSKTQSHIRLLPILAPTFTAFDQFDELFSRQVNERFYGAGVLAEEMPTKGTLSEWILWMIGQRMWRPFSFKMLARIWLQRYHPAYSVDDALKIIFCIDTLISEWNEQKKPFGVKTNLEELSSLIGQFPTGQLRTDFQLFLQKLKVRLDSYTETMPLKNGSFSAERAISSHS